MIRPVRAVGVALFALTGLLLACSSPDPVLYTIVPVTGAVQQGGPKVIVLQQIALERYLERLQIVRSAENYRLDVMSNDWWGEPLGAMLTRVLGEELGQRLPRSVVISEGGAVSAPPDATLSINILRLDGDSRGNLVLQAQASMIVKGRITPSLRSFRFVVPIATSGLAGQVAASSAAVGQLADGLAAMIVAGAPGR